MPALVSMAQQFNGLPMKSLIGGPLIAASEANHQMAMTQVNYLLNIAFEEQGKGYTPIMIQMHLSRPVIPDTEPTTGSLSPSVVTTTFNLPLLTILPLNSLAVTDVNITFEMEVKSSSSTTITHKESTNTKADIGITAKAQIGPFSVTVKGNASYDHKDSTTHQTHYQKSNSAKYTVSCTAGQLPLPKGVNVIIEAFTNAIQPIELKTTKSTSSPS